MASLSWPVSWLLSPPFFLKTSKIPTLKCFLNCSKTLFSQLSVLPFAKFTCLLSPLWFLLVRLSGDSVKPRPSASGISLVCIWLCSRPGFSPEVSTVGLQSMWMTCFWGRPFERGGSSEGLTVCTWLRFLLWSGRVDIAVPVHLHQVTAHVLMPVRLVPQPSLTLTAHSFTPCPSLMACTLPFSPTLFPAPRDYQPLPLLSLGPPLSFYGVVSISYLQMYLSHVTNLKKKSPVYVCGAKGDGFNHL